MERETGFEPATSSLGSWHSTTELLPHSVDSATDLILNRLRSQSGVYTAYPIAPIGPENRQYSGPENLHSRSITHTVYTALLGYPSADPDLPAELVFSHPL